MNTREKRDKEEKEVKRKRTSMGLADAPSSPATP